MASAWKHRRNRLRSAWPVKYGYQRQSKQGAEGEEGNSIKAFEIFPPISTEQIIVSCVCSRKTSLKRCKNIQGIPGKRMLEVFCGTTRDLEDRANHRYQS